MHAVHYTDLYAYVMSIICFYFLCLSLINIKFLKKNTRSSHIFSGAKVNILVPARNEAVNIKQCLTSLCIQNYDNYEVIVLDDNSTDSTCQIITDLCAIYPNLTLIQGKPLSQGWLGKPFALQQLLEHATGEYCLFIDADTVCHPNMLAFSVKNITHVDADLMSGYTQYSMRNMGERLILPAIYIMMAMVFPFFLIKHSKSPRHSFAVGMYMMYRTSALKQLGGFHTVKNEINEDIIITRRFKKNHFITHFIDAKSVICTHMYENFKGAYRGISKNIYPAADKNILETLLILLLISGIFVLPIILFIYNVLIANINYPLLLPIGITTVMWSCIMYNRNHSIKHGITYAITMSLLLCITLTSTKKNCIR